VSGSERETRMDTSQNILCPNCEIYIEANARFCKGCGYAIG
jgi:hypothetical protein